MVQSCYYNPQCCVNIPKGLSGSIRPKSFALSLSHSLLLESVICVVMLFLLLFAFSNPSISNALYLSMGFYIKKDGQNLNLHTCIIFVVVVVLSRRIKIRMIENYLRWILKKNRFSICGWYFYIIYARETCPKQQIYIKKIKCSFCGGVSFIFLSTPQVASWVFFSFIIFSCVC